MRALTHTDRNAFTRRQKPSRRRREFFSRLFNREFFSRLFKLAPCLCALLLFAPASAQDLDDAAVEGRVADEAGALLPGARVTAVRERDSAERMTLADAEGRYRLVELEPGAYTVRASHAGFAAEEKTNVLTAAGRRVALDFALRPAGLTAETIVVGESDASPVDTTRTIVGATVARDELERTPTFTRSPLDLVFTLGGVTEEPLSTRDAADDRDSSSRGGRVARHAETPEEAGAFALSGGAAYSNNVTLDGLDNNDDRAARERFQPSLEAVEEVQVITNQFSAEYGRASGGRVNLRTRGGSKELRGRLFYFFRDEALDPDPSLPKELFLGVNR